MLFLDVSEVGSGALQRGDLVGLGVAEGHQRVQLIAIQTDPPPDAGDSLSFTRMWVSETSAPLPAHLRSLSIRLCLSFRHPVLRERPLSSELLPDPPEWSGVASAVVGGRGLLLLESLARFATMPTAKVR